MRERKVGPVLVVALALGACALTASGCTISPPAAASTPDPIAPSMPGWARDQTPEPGATLSPSEAAGLTSMPWSLAEVSADRRTITVLYVAGDGDCVTHVGYRMARSGSAITLVEYSATASRSACADRAVVGLQRIDLGASLDEVTLLHAQADDHWAAILR